MENPAILLRRLNPYCALAMEGAASMCQARGHAEILPGYLPEQGEKGLTRYERDQKPHSLRLNWSKEEGIGLEFDVQQGGDA